MSNFSWDDLQYFLAVARDGQLSAAARRLRTSHVTVARRIDRLEQRLGAKLFERNPRGYVLTPLGARLMSPAETMAQEADKLLGEVGTGSFALSGVVRFSVPEGFGNFFIGEKLPFFAKRHPSLSIEMVNIQQIVSLSRREADISVALNTPKTGSYHREKISSYALYVYGSRQYLAEHGPVTDRSQLALHPFIGYIEDMIFTQELNYLGELLPGLRASYQSSSVFAQLKAARAGFGLCILPYFMAVAFDDLVPVLPESVRIMRDYWMVCHSDMINVARIRLLADFIREETHAASGFLTGEAMPAVIGA
ncbi:LysR family transcriptional regulator [Thalassospira sp. TSL5-1]|uniref:LysR family transcriptional regulator n=1 Tax=Thalassospira sp. TSL5-1 TaxID=1544451 RepID=UPI00093B783D|nr:LysR family transcriptional regulator [Thalassospira sp. TSL5-1]